MLSPPASVRQRFGRGRDAQGNFGRFFRLFAHVVLKGAQSSGRKSGECVCQPRIDYRNTNEKVASLPTQSLPARPRPRLLIDLGMFDRLEALLALVDDFVQDPLTFHPVRIASSIGVLEVELVGLGHFFGRLFPFCRGTPSRATHTPSSCGRSGTSGRQTYCGGFF